MVSHENKTNTAVLKLILKDKIDRGRKYRKCFVTFVKPYLVGLGLGVNFYLEKSTNTFMWCSEVKDFPILKVVCLGMLLDFLASVGAVLKIGI